MAISFYNQHQNQFASYFNMARQNVWLILNRLSAASGTKDTNGDKSNPVLHEDINLDSLSIPEENQILKMKVLHALKKSKPETQEYLLRQFYHYFPFLKIIALDEQKNQEQPITSSQVHKIFTDIVIVLNYERDRASHTSFVDERTNDSQYINTEKNVARHLNNIMVAAIKEIQRRFVLTDLETEFLSSKIHRIKTTDNELNTQKIKTDTSFQYSVLTKNGKLSDMGRVFLLCMLIEKRYASMFFDALADKNGKSIFYRHEYSEKQKGIVREVFSVFRIHTLKERLNNERDGITIALDMLNELKKCPAELYDHISPENKNRFLIISGNNEPILLKRSTDRFPRLSLQYIDENKIFQKIRFHVNFGKYRYCFTENKHCIDGEYRLRVIQKELNGFGRLNEIETARKGNKASLTWNGTELVRDFNEIERDNIDNLPYITDSRAQYLFNSDRIGMVFRTSKDEKMDSFGNYMPQIEKDNQIYCIEPTCWISIYELPAMMFHIHLSRNESDKNGCPTELIIKKCVSDYKKFFTDIIDENIQKIKCKDLKNPQPEEYRPIEDTYGIRWKDIPDKIKDHLTGRTRSTFEKYAKEAVKKMLIQTEARIRRFKADIEKIQSDNNRLGEKSFVSIKPGHLATFLAKDIISMQPSILVGAERGRDKLTGLNYRVMQAKIALFNRDRNALIELTNLFRNAKLIKSENPHPFLNKVIEHKPTDTIDLYWKYLEERRKYLSELLKKKNFKDAAFLHAERVKWAVRNKQYYKDLATRYLHQTIDLPRGLFEKDIKVRLLGLCENRPDLSEFEKELEKSECNVTYMILLYHKYINKDNIQSFYNFEKSYKITELLDGEKRYKPLNAYKNRDFKGDIDRHVDNLMVEQKTKSSKLKGKVIKASAEEKEIERRRLRKYFKEYDDNERLLRRLKVQDIIMFMLAKNMLGESVSNFKMKGIKPNKDEGILEVMIPFKITVEVKDSLTRETKKIDIYQDSIKIKNYGDFYRFLYDDRVKTLLPHIQSAKVDKLLLEQELMQYDITRPQVFDLLLKLEKSITDKNPDFKESRHGFTDLINSLNSMNMSDKEEIRLTRNAFSHNKYPSIEVVDTSSIPEIAKHLKKNLVKKIQKI